MVKRLLVTATTALTLAAASPASATWTAFQPGPNNYSDVLDVTEGLVCAEVGIMSGGGDDQVLCSTPSGTSGFTNGVFLNNGHALPGGVKGLAIYNTKTSKYLTHIHVLGNDNYVRTYQGDQAPATWYQQPGFINPVATIVPTDVDTGASLSIVKIVAVYAGWLGGSRHVVMALTSGGVAYTQYGSKWRKHPRLNTLGLKFRAVSSWKSLGGSYWTTASGETYYAYDMNSSPGPYMYKIATYSGRIRDLGYPYLLTNAGGSSSCYPLAGQTCPVSCTVSNTGACVGDADRVQRLVSGSWTRYPQQYMDGSPGMPGPVSVPPGGGTVDPNGPKNDHGIVDGTPFRGTDGEYFIHHSANRWYAWTP